MLLKLLAEVIERGLVLKREVFGYERCVGKEVISEIIHITASHGIDKDDRGKNRDGMQKKYPAEDASFHNSAST